MKNRKLILILLLVGICTESFATVILPNIFTDNMVLQRNSEVMIWGWGDINEEVTLTTSWDGASYSVKTPLTTRWEFRINTPGAGGPYKVGVMGKSNEVIFKNVLLGEVWLCSGQSNMEWSAHSGIDNAEEEIKNADYPNIRLYTVTKRTSQSEQDMAYGNWLECTPESMKYFSAVAYFFGRKLHGELNVPIGLIDTGWGATSAEVWTPSSVFEENDNLREAAEKIKENVWAPVDASILYNAMIHPIKEYKIAGTLWYQGESNTANAESYQELFTSMITAWRAAWGYDFPFYYVQIAPFSYGTPERGVLVRDQQRRVLRLPKTGMVVTSDICTVDDIHPQNKQDVGLRLANLALKNTYEKDIGIVSGPLFKETYLLGKKIEVVFDNARGLNFTGNQLTHFEIAGTDEVFYPAIARIKDDRVILSARAVKEPILVRYAWSNTAIPNLFNAAGLPASSFISN